MVALCFDPNEELGSHDAKRWISGGRLFIVLNPYEHFMFRVGSDEVSPNYFFFFLSLFLAIGVVSYYVSFLRAGIPWYVIFAPLIGISVLVLLERAFWAIWKKVREKSKK